METPATTGPRISFSADFLDDANFICITPQDKEKEKEKEKTRAGEFEFLSGNISSPATMLTADELFFEGKLLPFGQKEKLNKISIKSDDQKEIAKEVVIDHESNRMSWFIDEDPSPRPPKCTVLWKELLRLKKQRASSLSPSSSTSSSSSSSSSNSIDHEDSTKKEKEKEKHQQQVSKRIKKGLERTRSSGIKIRPMINLPICSQGGRSNSLPPLFSLRKGMLDR
ncbi:hypothetical protein L6452_22441 [Arctium lappa]|uniref:Uncharacterized protein n=1 Tax=Arctium lappa TaxID=4217 RepID=A0ACB9AZD7_ARCLA|nr:hypothetical protein L6452_22441 [Arctium lappa]